VNPVLETLCPHFSALCEPCLTPFHELVERLDQFWACLVHTLLPAGGTTLRTRLAPSRRVRYVCVTPPSNRTLDLRKYSEAVPPTSAALFRKAGTNQWKAFVLTLFMPLRLIRLFLVGSHRTARRMSEDSTQRHTFRHT